MACLGISPQRHGTHSSLVVGYVCQLHIEALSCIPDIGRAENYQISMMTWWCTELSIMRAWCLGPLWKVLICSFIRYCHILTHSKHYCVTFTVKSSVVTSTKAPVSQTCNSSYFEGIDQVGHGSNTIEQIVLEIWSQKTPSNTKRIKLWTSWPLHAV
jgi:hypothetical protein